MGGAARGASRWRAVALVVASGLFALVPESVAAAPSTVERQAGEDRYATAALVSAATFDPGVSEVVVATGTSPFDALAGSGFGAPLLLVNETVPPETESELRRLQPSRITVLGGPLAVSDDVVATLEQVAPTRRMAGDDRYATAAAISAVSFDPGVANVLIVSGETFADALSAGAVAARSRIPILMVRLDGLPESIAQELRRLTPGAVTVVGGPAAVSESVVDQIRSVTNVAVNRVAGIDRYETSARLAAVAYPNGHANAFVATGLGFADAIAGGPAAGVRGAPILLVPGTCVTDPVRNQIETGGVATMTILGGLSAVSAEVETLAVCPPPPPPGGRAHMIGDSVMLGAKAQLESIGGGWQVSVDAKVSRQFEHGIALIQAAASSGVERIVVHLGTNGVINDGQFDRAMAASEGVPKVVFVTIQLPPSYSYEASNNDVLRRGAARWNAAIADWNALSNANPEYVARDGYHMTASGARAYAQLVAGTL